MERTGREGRAVPGRRRDPSTWAGHAPAEVIQMKPIVLACALCAFASVAIAADEVLPRRFAPNQFPQLVELVESKMADRGQFAAEEAEREKVRDLLAEIGGMVEGKGRISELDANTRAAIEDRRKQINSLLADNATQVADAGDAPKKRRQALNMLDSRPAPGSD